MFPRISLITAVFAVAVVVAAPAAFGDSWGADQQSQTTMVGSPDAIDRALASELKNRAATREIPVGTGAYPDLVERTVGAYQRTHAFRGDDRFRIDHTNVPVTPTVTSSGREIEWPQVGIGLGVGMAFMLGLLLVVRARRQPPLAH